MGELVYMAERLPGVYSPGAGQWIAERYADGQSLRDLHRGSPDLVPSPLVVRRWRDAVPAFDALMSEAERARAEREAELMIEVAKSKRPAAKARNEIAARQWIAERLDRARYGSRVGVDVSASLSVEHVHTLSDAALAAIALSGREAVALPVGGRVVEAESSPACDAREITPVHPPLR